MQGSPSNDVLLLPISSNFERTKKVFEDVVPYRVYILHNQDPKGIDEKMNKKILRETEKIVETKTGCYGRDEVKVVGIDFYHFEKALKEAYRIVYREDQQGNDVTAHLSGGTRPVAIALTTACWLTNNGDPIYYASEGYEQVDDAEVESTGVLDESFKMSLLPSFDTQNVVPESNDRRLLLKGLLQFEEPARMNEILAAVGKIDADPPDDEDEKKHRNSLIRQYSGSAGPLHENGLVNKHNQHYELTNSGRIAAELVKIKSEVDAEF